MSWELQYGFLKAESISKKYDPPKSLTEAHKKAIQKIEYSHYNLIMVELCTLGYLKLFIVENIMR